VASIIIFFRRCSSQQARKISPIDGIAIIAITIISGTPKERPDPVVPFSMKLSIRPMKVTQRMQFKPPNPIMRINLINFYLF